MSTAASTAGTNGHAVAVEVDGVRYPSARSAAQALGLSPNGVSGRCHSDRWPDYRWLGATPGSRSGMTVEERRIARAFIEPTRWPNDGGARRAPILDINSEPPRVVRRVGWLRCMCCRRPTWSDDVVRVRMCLDCGGAGSMPVGARPSEDD